MPTPRTLVPTDLGRLTPIDALALEPGMIIWARFCVVGKVSHASPIWSVPVTDLDREFGHAPHHRVVLQYLPLADRVGERVRRAVAADEQVQPRVRATIDLPGGLTLVHDPVEGEHIGAQLPAREARALALALAGMLLRLNEAQVRGVNLRITDLRHSEGRFRLKDFEHLSRAGSAERDVEGLCALLRRAAGHHLTDLLEPAPRSAAELWSRAQSLTQRDADPVGTPLRQHPPFVDRDRSRSQLDAALTDAQIARSSVTLVCGSQGVGKTRLLQEFASSLIAEDRALVLRGEYLRGCGESRGGLRGALGRLPEALALCPPESGARVVSRLIRRTGDHAGVLASYAPALTELLGAPERPASLALEDDFARHAAAIADGIRGIGTQTRPLVLLLDNLQFADRGSIAILRRLLIEDRSHHTMIVAGLCGRAPSELADPDEGGHWNPHRDPQLLLRKIGIDPLRAEELEQLVAAGLPGPVARPREVAEALYETCDGNPLVAWATLRSWIEGGVLVRGERGAWELRRRKLAGTSPERVFAERVERASLDERWLGLLAAVAGSHVDEAWFQRVSGWAPGRVASAVQGLERRGLMGEAGETSLRFPHELVRDLLIARVPAGEVRRAHADIASWLASLGPRVSPARLAYHTDRALGQDSSSDPRLIEMHLAAGREMLGVYDLERSGWHFTRALVETGDGRLAAFEGAADVALLGGNYDEAAQRYAEAVVEARDPLTASRIASKAVHGLFRKSAASEAAAIARLALAQAHRALPESDLGRLFALVWAHLDLALRGDNLGSTRPAALAEGPQTGAPPNSPKRTDELAEQLCWLYARMALVTALREPSSAWLCLLRGMRLARELDSPAAANVIALYGASLAIRGDLEVGRRLLAEATERGRAAGSDWAQGMVTYIRGNFTELATGAYSQGLASLDEAIGHFRRTGDLSIAVSSLFFKAVYGRDREPLSVVHGWLDEAAALSEAQGDTVVDLGIDALRLYLRARAGAHGVVEAATSLSARTCARDMVSFEDYLPHAYLALALLEVDEPARARVQIDLAIRRMIVRRHMPEYAFDLWVAIALVLVQTHSSRGDRRRLARALRRLDAAARSSPRLRALALIVRLRRALAAGQCEAAEALAASVIAGFSEHAQTQPVLEAHRALSEILRGSDVLAAREHLRLAQGISRELGLDDAAARERELAQGAMVDLATEDDAPRTRTRERSSRARSAAYLRALARNETVEVAAVLEASRPVLLETIGKVPWVYLRAQPELRVHGDLVEIQSLLVHLALCARDSIDAPEQLRAEGNLAQLDEAQAAAIPGASAGNWGRIAVSVVGAANSGGGVTGGVSACRQVATRMGGFLDVEQDDSCLTLSVYLPPESSGAEQMATQARAEALAQNPVDAERPTTQPVLVLHSDSLLRATLTSAISRLGHDVEQADPESADLRKFADVGVLFVQSEALADYGSLLPAAEVTIEIGSRGVQASGDHPLLRVPFALGELRRLLESP